MSYENQARFYRPSSTGGAVPARQFAWVPQAIGDEAGAKEAFRSASALERARGS